MKPSADAIITAIIFLAVGLKPIPVAVSSIFLNSFAEISLSYSDNFLFACVSNNAICLSNRPSPSNMKHFCGTTLSGTRSSGFDFSKVGFNDFSKTSFLILFSSVTVGRTIPVLILVVSVQFTSVGCGGSMTIILYSIGFGIGVKPLDPSVGFSANDLLNLVIFSCSSVNAASFTFCSNSLNRYTVLPLVNIIGFGSK